ncbi:MAG: hypothetical protein ABR987_05235 [Terracidiphilus sp.]|jgi:hypothetical protein
MKKKKSRIELAREIIANLRRGMNRPLNDGQARHNLAEAIPFTPLTTNRSKRSNQLQTSLP